MAKRVELRNTFMDLGERYRALARKTSQQKHGSFAKPSVEAKRLGLFEENTSPMKVA
jgi:hypothetical protein